MVPELEARAAEYPVRERTTAQLMLALYRSGRQADALEVHARARRALVEELGLEPGRELQELLNAILNHDPRLAGRDPAPSLPVPATQLVGRAAELEELVTILARDDVRLVTVGGPGGIGKTRLALAAAADLAEGFPGGARLVDLSSLREPELVLPTIAQSLDVTEQASQPLEDAVVRLLTERAMLLVLDNFEQVVDAAPVVARLLAACRSEGTRDKPRTVASPRRACLRARFLREEEAVALLVDRVRAVQPAFDLGASHIEVARAICRRLDSLPLALELVAPRFRVLAPTAILERLQRSLDLLTDGARDLPERQQTLRGAIDWSFRMLDPSEQRLLARLAIFSGGCTIAAAEAVCVDCESLLDELGVLVAQKSCPAVERGWCRAFRPARDDSRVRLGPARG